MSSKKRKKAYYIKSAKKRRSQLDVGMRGFLLTCNNNCERRAVQECYNLLNEYADLLYGQSKQTSKPDDAGSDCSDDDDDFESAIRKEVADEKTQRETSTRRFQVVDTRTTNCIFIKTTLEHPEEIVAGILADVYKTRIAKSRFILKMFPVLGTCRSTAENIEKLAETVLEPIMKTAGEVPLPLTYCTIYKVRCNNLGREEILPMIGRVALRLNPAIRVNFSEPEVVVSVDVLGKICSVSVMRNFYQYRKYNMQEIVKISSNPDGIKVVDGCESALGAKNNSLNLSAVSSSATSGDGSHQKPTDSSVMLDVPDNSGMAETVNTGLVVPENLIVCVEAKPAELEIVSVS